MSAFKPGDRVHLKGHTHAPATLGTVEDFTPFRVYVQWDDGPAITPHVPHHLEPAGEPMTTDDFFAEPGSHNPEPKTFNSALGHGRVIEVQRVTGKVNLVIRKGPERLNSYIGISLEPADIPALALAILEAAGHEADSDDASSLVNSAMGRLAMHVATEATKVKEAADREALEGEATKFLDVLYPFLGAPSSRFDQYGEQVQKQGLELARAARTLHGVKA